MTTSQKTLKKLMLYSGIPFMISGLFLMFENQIPFKVSEDFWGVICGISAVVLFFTFIAYIVTLVKEAK